MKSLELPKDERLKLLKRYCGHKECRTTVGELCKLTQLPIEKCPHPEKQRYEVVVSVPATKKDRQTKLLATRDMKEAIKEAIEFRKQVKEKVRIISPKFKSHIRKIPFLLTDVISTYLAYLQGDGVPVHLKRVRSEEHVADVERISTAFLHSLKKAGVSVELLHIQDLNDNHVGVFDEYLLVFRQLGNRTYNKYMNNMKGMMKWFSVQFDIPVSNCFSKVPKRPENPQPRSISKDEFERLLEKITHENGRVFYPNGIRYKRGDKVVIKRHRNFYWKHLKLAFKLGLFTGLRREELISLKFSDIKDVEGIKFIQVPNFKVNKIQNRRELSEMKFIFVPITPGLEEVLIEAGLNSRGKTTEYILAPEVTDQKMRTKSMSDTMSRGFKHFYSLVNPEGGLTFRSLRKTYITSMAHFMSGDAKSITQHSDNDVLEKYYIDKKAMLKVSQNFEPFINNEARQKELDQTRTKIQHNENNRGEVER